MTVTVEQLDKAARNAGIAERDARDAERSADELRARAEWHHTQYALLSIEWEKTSEKLQGVKE